MYRRQSNSSRYILLTVASGILLGVGYLLHDRYSATDIVTTPPSISSPVSIEALEFDTDENISLSPKMENTTEGAILLIPTLGIASEIVEVYVKDRNWDTSYLGAKRVGHLYGTAWLKMNSNIVLAGHTEMADGQMGVFASLDKLAIGDMLIISQSGHEQYYRVSLVFTVEPTDLAMVYPTGKDQLTLITCTEYDLAQNVYHRRMVAAADRIN